MIFRAISWRLIRQIMAFGCVGVLATGVHYVTALSLTEFAGINIFTANVGGYLTAVLVSLYGHSVFTYRKKLDSVIAGRFFIVSVSTLLVSEGILLILEKYFSLSHRVSLAIVVSSIPIVTFFINKFWVYRAAH